MKSRATASEASSAKCPRCDASIHTTGSLRRRRVQCPKCREVVLIGGPVAEEKNPEAAEATETAKTVVTAAPADADELAALRGRVDALEITVAGLQQAVMEAASRGKMRWVTPGTEPGYSKTQAEALRENLATLPAHRIIIEAAPGDIMARERAEWFKMIFTDARWLVIGPGDAPSSHVTRPGLSLATGLPVSAKAAGTYLAVRAAGFDITTIFDADLVGDEPCLIIA